MARSIRQPRASIVLAMLQLVLGLGGAADLVLCREASGAVAVESLLAGDCCPDHGLLSLAAVGPGEACECVDTPLLANAVERRHDRTPLDPLLVLAGLPPRPVDPRSIVAAAVDRRGRPAPLRAALATIVLRV